MMETEKRLKLFDRGIYFLSTDINPESAATVVNWILEANINQKLNKFKHLTLIINSPGGNVTSSFAITDTMRGSAVPVHTIGLGMIASCGLLVFMAGAKGHRVLTPNTSILSHQYSWATWGKEHELLAHRREQDLTGERILQHYREHTGLSDKVIREKLLPAEDIWLSAAEAKKYNLCDSVKDFKAK